MCAWAEELFPYFLFAMVTRLWNVKLMRTCVQAIKKQKFIAAMKKRLGFYKKKVLGMN